MDPKGSIFKRYECKDSHKKGKHLKGCKVTGYWARVTYTDPESGKPKDLQRRAKSRAHATDLKDELLRDIKTTAGRSVGSERMSFADLCTYFENHYVKEAEYVEGRKVAGLRSVASVKGHLKTLKTHFAERPLRSLTYGSIRQFRETRFKAKIKRENAPDRQRSHASVNRELALLRRMLNVATAEGWLIKSPFTQGASLISLADEKKRERILTQTEEKTLLEACSAPKRGHLSAIIIAALDTGCRLGELLKLRWRDVDMETGLITVVAFNTKTQSERIVGLSARLKAELEQLRAMAPDDSSYRVFGILNNVKRSFTGARTDAGLPDLRFHDLRHSSATRQVRQGIPLSEVGRNHGHQQPQTTWRYVNADIETAQRAAAAVDRFNAPVETQEGLVN